MKDLFEKHKPESMWEEFGVNPFSVLDSRDKRWKQRRKQWLSLGIKGEASREETKAGLKQFNEWVAENADKKYIKTTNGVSIFDPVLCEQMYRWFCKDEGTIIDPFAGGSVRGIVAHKLGYRYTGIDIRPDQILSNIEQGKCILENDNQPNWIIGDSRNILALTEDKYDMLFTCPPYGNLEVYSNLEGDISNMKWLDFVEAYRDILMQSCALLKEDSFAVLVVGEFRGANHFYRGFVPLTIRIMQDIGMEYYNEAIYYMSSVSAGLRARKCMETKKLAKVHQNILIFKKVTRDGKRIYKKNDALEKIKKNRLKKVDYITQYYSSLK